jgi:hypothetical protein
MASIEYSTVRIQTENAAVYNSYLNKMADFTARRDALVAEIREVLDGAAFGDTPIKHGTAASLAGRANGMVSQMKGMAHAAH